MSRLKKYISLLLVVVMVLSVLPTGVFAATNHAVRVDFNGSSGTEVFKVWKDGLGSYVGYTLSIDARAAGGATSGKFTLYAHSSAHQYKNQTFEVTDTWQTFTIDADSGEWYNGGIDILIRDAGVACSIEFDNIKLIKNEDGKVPYSHDCENLNDWYSWLGMLSVVEATANSSGSTDPSVPKDNHVLKMTSGSETGKYIYNNKWVEVPIGEEYTVSFKAKGHGKLRATFSQYDGGPAGATVSMDLDGDQWVAKTYTFTAEDVPNRWSAMVFYLDSANSEVYLDDVSVEGSDGASYVLNGDFENGRNDWNVDGVTIEIVVDNDTTVPEPSEPEPSEPKPSEPKPSEPEPSEPTTTNHVLHLTAGSWTEGLEWMDDLPGGDYIISYAAKGNAPFQIGFRNWESPQVDAAVGASLTDEWKLYYGIVSPSVKCNLALLIGDPGGDVYIDDLRIWDKDGVLVYHWDFEEGRSSSYSASGYRTETVQTAKFVSATRELMEVDLETTDPGPFEPIETNEVMQISKNVTGYVQKGWYQVHDGAQYTYTYYIKGNGTVRVGFNRWGNDYPTGASTHVTVNSDEWQRVTGTYTYNGEHGGDPWVTMNIYIDNPNEGEIYVDNISVVRLMDGVSAEYVTADFEGGINWENHTNGSVTTVRMAEPVMPANFLDVSAYRSGETFTAPTAEGKVFAGWYTDAEFTTPLDATVATGMAYAKFVDAAVLRVMWQISSDATADSEKTNLRLLTSVDSLDYSNVGFTVEFNGQTRSLTTRTVYRAITGYTDEGGVKYQPTVFSEQSQYFMAHNLKNVPSSAFGSEILVTPKWTTLDGTVVTGTPLGIVINTSF